MPTVTLKAARHAQHRYRDSFTKDEQRCEPQYGHRGFPFHLIRSSTSVKQPCILIVTLIHFAK